MLRLNLTEKLTKYSVTLLLAAILVLGISSMSQENATMDELAHIPAGYSYIFQKDYRLNPEHPPLVKDLSGLALLGQNINFPSEHKAWNDDINGQWDWGNYWLFNAGNNADKIVFWARLPILLLTILLGIYIFQWTKEVFGKKAGLLALILFSFSPSFLAHGHLVTTDVAAALGFFAAIYHFWHFLKNNSKRNLIFAGLAFGIAQLLKFSLFILVPFLSIIALIWVIIHGKAGFKKRLGTTIYKTALVFFIGYLLILPVYQYHLLNYPPERQVRDTEFNLSSFGFRPAVNLTIWLADKPVLRTYGQYLLGLLMVIQRASGGNTAYFWGEVSSQAWPSYFPLLYLLKIPLAFHFLTLMALMACLSQIKIWFSKKRAVYEIIEEENNYGKQTLETTNPLFVCLKKRFPEVIALLFLALYWYISITSNLNIGVRHILPTLPFMYLLVSGHITRWLEQINLRPNINILQKLKLLIAAYAAMIIKTFLVIMIIFWYVIGTLIAYPHFIPYYNELAGGSKNGYKIAVDSNLDWGQDLKNLTKFVEQNNIEKIRLDYFGGGDARYYLGDKFIPYNPIRDNEVNGWLAVSATFLQQGRAKQTKGFNQPTDYYEWLDRYEPKTVIGHSIFVYYIP